MRALYLCFLLMINSILLAQKPGTPDSSFGRDGRVWDTLGNYPPAHVMLIQPDDKIVVGGIGFLKGSHIKTFRVERGIKDGRPDYSFGDSGKVLVEFHFSDNEYNHESSVTCMALQPDGKIVAGGYYSKRSGNNSIFVIVRLLPDGTIDSSFGTNGMVVPRIPQSIVTGKAVVVQANGSIVFGGTCERVINDRFFFIARILPDGSPDKSFGQKGFVIENYGTADLLALQPDGKIIAGGENGLYWEDTHLLLRRYLVNGVPDKSFGNKGSVDTSLVSGADHLNDMVLQPDGKIVVAGNGSEVYRFNSNGSIDNRFGMQGKAVSMFPNKAFPGYTYGTKLLIANNRILLAGEGGVNIADNQSDLWLLAYRSTGTIDSAFANNGLQTAGYGYADFTGSAGLQSDGKIILYGLSNGKYDSRQVRSLLRYYGYPYQTLITYSVRNKSFIPVAASSLRVYPNPASEYIMISNLQADSGTAIFIHDGLGKTVALYQNINAAQYRCDVSKLRAGIYYVQVKTGSKIETLRFVKD